jgi:hypothetical protein
MSGHWSFYTMHVSRTCTTFSCQSCKIDFQIAHTLSYCLVLLRFTPTPFILVKGYGGIEASYAGRVYRYTGS